MTAELTQTVKTHFPDGSEETEEIDVVGFPEGVEPAKVSVSLGGKLSTRKYENVSFYVSATIPCYAEEMDAAAAKAREFVERRCEEIVTDVRENS